VAPSYLRERNQPKNQLPRFEPGVVIGAATHEHASSTSAIRMRVPAAFSSLFAHKRDTPSLPGNGGDGDAGD
jgi:hypothetical protein